MSLNGAVVVSNLFNETVTAGGYGLISMKGAASGQSSFDVIRLKTDDTNYAPPPALLVAAADPILPLTGTSITLTSVDLAGAVAQAKRNWAATGLSVAALAKLDEITVVVADLTGSTLGEESRDAILIDGDAAGRGWFVDVTPADNAEFSLYIDRHAIGAAAGSVAYGKMDLVTVVTHEMGHVLGFDHYDASKYSVMREDLDPGVRYVLDAPGARDSASAPVNDSMWLRLASQGAEPRDWSRKAKPTDVVPVVAGDALGGGGSGSGIDWNDRLRGNWGTYLSPFGTGPSKSAPNFTDFLAKVIGSNGDESADDRDGVRFGKGAQSDKGAKFDKMGGALNSGSHTKPGRGAGR